MHSLANFLTHGAPLHALRAREPRYYELAGGAESKLVPHGESPVVQFETTSSQFHERNFVSHRSPPLPGIEILQLSSQQTIYYTND